MKTKTLLAIMAVWTIAFASLAVAQDKPNRDPRQIAVSFLKLGAEAKFTGDFNYSVVLSEGVAVYNNGNFTATANTDGTLKEIQTLSLNGEDIPLAEPLKRFPHDARGKMTSFWISLNGASANGKNVSYGSFHAEALQESDPINITLYPSWVEVFVPAELPAGVKADSFRLRTADGNLYGYDQYRKGFGVWLDPVNTAEVEYDLIDVETGKLVESGGVLQPFGGSHQTPDNAIGVSREAGVVITSITPDNRYGWFDNLKFRTEITYYGDQLPATVFGVRGLEGGNLSVELGGLIPYQSAVRIEEILKDGTLRLIKEAVVEDKNSLRLMTQGSYQEVVVTVFGLKDADRNGFWLNLQWQPPQNGSSGGGGGKG